VASRALEKWKGRDMTEGLDPVTLRWSM